MAFQYSGKPFYYPLMFGLNAPKDSYGKAESKGLEITLGHKNKVGDFSYYIEGMLTCNTNKITEMDELEPMYLGSVKRVIVFLITLPLLLCMKVHLIIQWVVGINISLFNGQVIRI